MPGPYLRARFTDDFDKKLDVDCVIGENAGSFITLQYPTSEPIFDYIDVKMTEYYLTSRSYQRLVRCLPRPLALLPRYYHIGARSRRAGASQVGEIL